MARWVVILKMPDHRTRMGPEAWARAEYPSSFVGVQALMDYQIEQEERRTREQERKRRGEDDDA